MAAARQAFEVWGTMRPAERRRLLTRFAGLLRDHIPDFAAICPLENGVCIGGWADNVGPHVAEWTEYYAGWADKIEGMVGAAYSPHENVEYTIAEPYGVIGHIITWNSPALSLAMKVPPSLAAGNTVVIKPAESTPFSALLFADLAREAGIPEGVINVVTGLGDAGCGPGDPPRRRQDLLHRRPRHRAPHHGRRGTEPQAGRVRAGRQVRQPALRRHRPGHRRPVLRGLRHEQHRAGLRAAHPAAGASARSTTRSSRGSPG